MIREPYGVVPYNTTIDTSINNTFSLIFNGDELESYKYELYENNTDEIPVFSSEKKDEPTIYNGDTLSFETLGSDLSFLTGKNLLWKILLWENNAFYKITNYKEISKSTSSSAPTTIFLQDEDSFLSKIDWSKTENIVNIIIRNERRRIISYNVGNNSVVVNKAFSNLPTKGITYTDKYVIYSNNPITENENTPKIMATIPILNGITTDLEVFGMKEKNSIISTGVIPSIENISDNKLQKEVVVNLDFGDNKIYRIKEYWKWEVQFDIEKTEIKENKQYYKVTKTKTTYHEGQTNKTTEVIEDVTDTSWYQEHDGDIGAYCVVDNSNVGEIKVGTSFSVYKNYYETNYYFFKSRKEAIINIDNFPENADSFPSRYYNFIGSYQQRNNIPIKYHIWEVYDITKVTPIYQSEKQFNSNLNFEYDNFENYHTYRIKLIIENQEGAKSEYISPNLVVSYKAIDLKTSGEAILNNKTYSADVIWPDNRLSIPTLVSGEDAEFNYFFDSQKKEKLNLKVPLLTQYKYDNLSGGKLQIDAENFMISTFIAIEDPGPTPWNGEIIRLSSNPLGNRISLLKNKYKLQIVCSDETSGGSITYDFFKMKKIAENNFINLNVPFSLLQVVSGQQQGVLQENGKYRPLNDEEKIGYAYEWMESNGEEEILWNNNYFWTETTSNTNTLVYKLLIYPNRAELYPMFRWAGKIKEVNGNKIKIGANRLLTSRTNKTLIMVNKEIKEVLDYDLTSGIATIDSPFSKININDDFLCYYENGENAANDNLYVCNFIRRNNIPFNEVSIFGDVYYNYLTIFEKNYFESSEIHKMLDYFYNLEWTNENQTDILINCNFDGALSSKYYEGIESEINGYRIYRNTYYSEDDSAPFESYLIAKIDSDELHYVNENTFLKITDYSIRNRGIFNYSVVPITNTTVGVKIETNKIKTDWYEWIFTSIGNTKENIYRPIDQWAFKLNIEAGAVQHNINKVIHQGISKYPKFSVGQTNYITTSLSCLISDFSYETIYKDNYLLPATSGKITSDTLETNNIKVYIQQFNGFEGINFQEKEAYIFISNQQRKITFYGKDLIEGEEKYYVIIEEPFKYFSPSVNNPSFNNYIIYTNFLPNEMDESLIVKKRKVIFNDSIERINAWNKFISSDEPLLIRDMKGNCYIGIITDSSEQTDIKIDVFPTTINFNITQIANVNSYLIFEV